MIENAIYKLLSGSTAITDITGDNAVHYELNRNQTQTKFLVYSVQSRERSLHINNDSGMQKLNLQVDCYAKLRREVLALRDAVVTLLQAQSYSADGEDIQFMRSTLELGTYEESTELFRISLGFDLFFV